MLDSVPALGAVASTMKIQDLQKALITIEGTNHYGITNQDSERDPNRPVLDQSTATGSIGRWSGLFLRSHLLGDQGTFNYVYKTGSELDPNVNVSFYH